MRPVIVHPGRPTDLGLDRDPGSPAFSGGSRGALRLDTEPDADNPVIVADRDPFDGVVIAMPALPVLDAVEAFTLGIRELPGHVDEPIHLDAIDGDDHESLVVAVEEHLSLSDLVEGFTLGFVLVPPQTGRGALLAREHKFVEVSSHVAGPTEAEGPKPFYARPHAEMLASGVKD